MYKRKIYLFGITSGLIMMIALCFTAVSSYLTQINLEQSNTAQTLLAEHQKLSSISYRMFKQLTDELIFGESANQAIIRNKQALIGQSLEKIRRLELQQRQALGNKLTAGSVEDTDELAALINAIIAEFKAITAIYNNTPLDQQNRLRTLLEVKIDNEFREAINAAVVRQGNVVAALNAKIETLNTAIVWFAVGIALFATPCIILACYWLFNQLYQPLTIINNGTNAIAAGDYQQRLPETLDTEFSQLVKSLNLLATKLADHEMKAEQSRRQLEFEVEQRTREISQVNEQLTKVDSRRRQFLADVSHELRTPLTIIRGEAQVTLRQSAASEQVYRETLDSILVQAINLSELVDDLLLLARAELSQLKLDTARQALGDFLHGQVSQWQRLHKDRDFTLEIDNHAKTLQLSFDHQRLKQVVAILLDNACKYSAPQTPVIVSLKQINNRACIDIKDFGEGISPSDINHIFERFVRFKHKSEGLGLGLAIAKAIVEAHGGEIRVSSTPGEGALFQVYLPMDVVS
ncbi:HAMP domain-containing histidine kinase [Aestuariibacter sp. GS-14]|uniref:ATP-binding protein n=1 Tax=Aestuariibacter sp. GS-14 TaxID=2590670 RepID=UPI001126280E|nr:HAMP domain-containing sensor histidine kinase [Aestuariibacter sp. GS-14]TPV57874.1 HAMP domain-containing histidine kinase [Aestuariibacter sp. GS-14]